MRQMNLNNFTFSKDLIGVELDGRYYDLHNCYDFESYAHNSASSIASLRFEALREEWVNDDIPDTIQLKFNGVEAFEEWEEESNFPDDGTTLEEIGFFENSTRGRTPYNGSREPFEGGQLLVFTFLDGKRISIIAEQATCEIGAHNNQINQGQG